FTIQNSVCLTNAMGRQTLLHRHIAPTHDTTGQITGAVIILHETAETHPSSPGTHHLSHDLNNAFTGIIGNLSLLKERPGLPPGMKENLTLIERSAQKAFELAQQLLPKRD
ncbi:MAG TPA: histidine kinase dimerization/phospho-acceptor domain-containing protein, partial [Verrucomicrobiae bacterium]